MARHPFHNDAMPCPLADSYLGVIVGLEEAHAQMARRIEILKEIIRRDATEHLDWRAALAAAIGPTSDGAATLEQEGDA